MDFISTIPYLYDIVIIFYGDTNVYSSGNYWSGYSRCTACNMTLPLKTLQKYIKIIHPVLKIFAIGNIVVN